MNVITIVCVVCLIAKPSTLFRPQRKSCKDCEKKKRQAYTKAHPDAGKETAKIYAIKNAAKIAANKKEWFAKNREQEMIRMKEWREANAEHRKEYAAIYDTNHIKENRDRGRNYREKNACRVKEALNEWRMKNPEKRREHRIRFGAVRRVREFGGAVIIDRTISLELLLKRDGSICHICGANIDVSLPSKHKLAIVIDHLFPIAFGGSHTWDNVGLAHFSCNSKVGHAVQIP